jgi:hypothetical protein
MINPKVNNLNKNKPSSNSNDEKVIKEINRQIFEY